MDTEFSWLLCKKWSRSFSGRSQMSLLIQTTFRESKVTQFMPRLESCICFYITVYHLHDNISWLWFFLIFFTLGNAKNEYCELLPKHLPVLFEKKYHISIEKLESSALNLFPWSLKLYAVVLLHKGIPDEETIFLSL